MYLLRFFLLPLLLLVHHGFIEAKTCDKIVHYIFENLEVSGVLEQDANGFVYVKVDDDYIYKLHEFIADEGFDPPPYFDRELAHGAHITVMPSHEIESCNIGKIDELGSTVFFRIKSCQIWRPTSWRSVSDVYVVTVDAPFLEKIRKKYRLPTAKYDFHITIGVKYSNAA